MAGQRYSSHMISSAIQTADHSRDQYEFSPDGPIRKTRRFVNENGERNDCGYVPAPNFPNTDHRSNGNNCLQPIRVTTRTPAVPANTYMRTIGQSSVYQYNRAEETPTARTIFAAL